MTKVVALDIETKDPDIRGGHSYLHKDFKLLDCGASYFNDKGVLTSLSFDFTNVKQGMGGLISFLREHKFDKIIWHNAKYDLPRLMHFGFPIREFYYTDTMLYSTLLEPFRPNNTLKFLCEEYDVEVKKISDQEMINDIFEQVHNEIELDPNKDIEKQLHSYVKTHYGIDLKKIKEYLLELKQHFPVIYKQYLTADTEATLLLYYKLDAEMEKLCSNNFDNTFVKNGKTLKDVLKTEELGIVPDIIMSTTELPLNWERVETENSIYQKEIQKLYDEYEIFFSSKIEFTTHILDYFKNLLETKYPNIFLQELDLINYCIQQNDLGNLNDEEIKSLLKQSFIFQEIKSVSEQNFKSIATKYKGDIQVPSKFITDKGEISLSDKAIKYLLTLDNLPKEIILIIEVIHKFNKITTNYNKFIKPFMEAKEKKGGLYTELYSYKTAIQRSFSVGTEDSQMGTVTGRMSCNNFNIQTIPKPKNDNFKIREMFLPRAVNFKTSDVKFISADWKAQENRLAAVLGNIRLMLDMYLKDQNSSIHDETVKNLGLLKYDEDATKEEIDKAKEYAKNKAKAVNFGMFYFQEAKNLSVSLGLTLDEGKKLIADFNSKYPEVLEFYKTGIRTFAKYGYVANLYGRIYKPYKMKVLYNLDDFADNFKLGERFDLHEKNHIMRNRVEKIREYLFKIWELDSESFYNKLMTIEEYKNIKPLKSYEYYVKVLDNVKKDIYDKDTLEEIIYLMFHKNLLHENDDDTIKDIIAIHAKMIFKDHNKFKNWDYSAECILLKGGKVKRDYPYKSTVKALRGEDLENWSGQEDEFQFSKFVWSWSWHICNCSIEYTFDFVKKIVNAMCQGSGADMLKTAKANMWKDGISDPENPNFCFDIHFPVHDAFEGTIKADNIDKSIETIKKYMEFNFDGIEMRVDTEVGDTWK